MKTLSLAALLLTATTASAQLGMPPDSPPAKLVQVIGLSEVTVEYCRPGVKGREVFGAMLPYGDVWRTGANASTKVTFDRDVDFGGEPVPAGTYALYTIPEAKSWTVILSRKTDLWGAGGYTQDDDLLRVTADVRKLKQSVESFTIDFQGFHINGADLRMAWDDVEVSVPVFMDNEAAIFARIDAEVINATGEVSVNTYFDAAKFYYAKRKDLALAGSWVEMAVEENPGAFWMVFFRAEVAHADGDHDTAVEWAQKAFDMASAAESDYGYLAKSRMLLDELKASGAQ